MKYTLQIPPRVKKWGLRLSYAALTVIGLTILNDSYIKQVTKGHLFADVYQVPEQKTGLLLGTAKTLANGQINLYFKYRIEAAVRLFKSGKIEHIIVSGDNSTKDYNEPADMQTALIEKGIPADRIHLDYAGFRTLDSVVRARYIFGQQQFTIISQPFHNARAVYIARSKGLDVIGFNAKEVPQAYGYTVRLREFLARAKMQLDLIFGKKPKFLGESVRIE